MQYACWYDVCVLSDGGHSYLGKLPGWSFIMVLPSASNKSNLCVHKLDGALCRLGSNVKCYCSCRKHCQHGTVRVEKTASVYGQ